MFFRKKSQTRFPDVLSTNRGVRRNLLRVGLKNGFLQIPPNGGGEELFFEIDTLNAKLEDERVTVARIMAETNV